MLANWPPVTPSRFLESFPKLSETISDLYAAGILPPSDLYVGDEYAVVEIAVPGADPNDFQVAVTPNSVTVTGRTPREINLGDAQFQNIWRGDFHTELTLPVSIDPSTAEAIYQDGILKLRMAKVAAGRPHMVEVRRDGEPEEAGTLPNEKLHRETVSPSR